MQYWKQLVKHGDNNGDCFRTCVACLLDKHPEDVPHFFDRSIDDPYTYMREWLASENLQIIFMPMWAESVEVLTEQIMPVIAPGCYYILCGCSSEGENHAVVYCNDELVHDPSWTDVAVKQPIETGEFFVGFLIDQRFCK